MAHDFEPPLPLGWSIDTCAETLRIRCDAAEAAPDLTAHGWRLRLIEDDLCLADLARPRGFSLEAPDEIRPWSQDRTRDAYAAYTAAFRERPGFPGWPHEHWTSWATGYESFRPRFSRIVYAGDEPAAFLVAALESDGLWIVQMGVAPAHRRRGVARALLEGARRDADDAGCEALRLSVNVDNPEARALYEAFGFRFQARRAVYRREDGDPPAASD